MQVTLIVNGETQAADIEPRLLLAHFLREHLGLRAASVDCDTTSCGACPVLLDGLSVKSCTVLTVQADGGDVVTAEGVADRDPVRPHRRGGRPAIPAPFDYIAAETTGQVIELLGQYDDAKLLAGGHSLLPMMKLRLATPAVLIDINRVEELAGVSRVRDELVVGATTRHAQVAASALVREAAPLLAHAAAQAGDPKIRHRGTIGGSLAHADPAADLPMALVALGGSVELRGPGGIRMVSADDFFTGYFETALAPGELITTVRVPATPGQPWGYQKFTRRANDWAIVGVATAGGRIALASMGPVPMRATASEAALASGATPARVAELAAEGTAPGEDIHADRTYRQHLARILVRRALEHQVA